MLSQYDSKCRRLSPFLSGRIAILGEFTNEPLYLKWLTVVEQCICEKNPLHQAGALLPA